MERLLLLIMLALPSASIQTAGDALDDQPPRPPELECVQSRSEVRPNHPGYNHVVVLSNRCEVTFRCVVTTDVSPDPTTADVDAHRSVDVVTFQSSPASTFTYKATCSPKQ